MIFLKKSCLFVFFWFVLWVFMVFLVCSKVNSMVFEFGLL